MSLKNKVGRPLAYFFLAGNLFLCGYGYVKPDKMELQIISANKNSHRTWFNESMYGSNDKIKVKESKYIFVHMNDGNLEAIVKSDRDIKSPKKIWMTDILYEDEAIFEENNSLTKEKTEDGYVTKFRTNYMAPEEFFSMDSTLDDLDNIPLSIKKRYIKEPSSRVKKYVDELVGDEKDIRTLIKKFSEFADKVEFEVTFGKSIHKILREYEETGRIMGNCKEVRTIMKSFCNARGIPVKILVGNGTPFHTWPEICVPFQDGYRWLKHDVALGNYIELPGQYAISKTPKVKDSPVEGYVWLYKNIKKLKEKIF